MSSREEAASSQNGSMATPDGFASRHPSTDLSLIPISSDRGKIHGGKGHEWGGPAPPVANRKQVRSDRHPPSVSGGRASADRRARTPPHWRDTGPGFLLTVLLLHRPVLARRASFGPTGTLSPPVEISPRLSAVPQGHREGAPPEVPVASLPRRTAEPDPRRGPRLPPADRPTPRVQPTANRSAPMNAALR